MNLYILTIPADAGEKEIVVWLHLCDEEDRLLGEAHYKGNPLTGPYSVIKHAGQYPEIQPHLHIFKKQNQICALNQNGTGHDGYHGYPLPNRVAKALRAQYPTWRIPEDGIVESITHLRLNMLIQEHVEGR